MGSLQCHDGVKRYGLQLLYSKECDHTLRTDIEWKRIYLENLYIEISYHEKVAFLNITFRKYIGRKYK